MHDHQQWTAMYVGSLAARMTTTGDGDSWKQRRSGCSRKDTVAPGRAGIVNALSKTADVVVGANWRRSSIANTCGCRCIHLRFVGCLNKRIFIIVIIIITMNKTSIWS